MFNDGTSAGKGPAIEYAGDETDRQTNGEQSSKLSLLDILGQRGKERQERREEKKEERKQERQFKPFSNGFRIGAGAGDTAGGTATELKNTDNIASLTPPKGFDKVKSDEPGQHIYQPKGSTTTKLGYEKVANYQPGPEAQQAFRDIVGKKKLHEQLNQDEIDKISEAIPNGLYGYNGNFEVKSLHVAEFGGRRVLVMETKFNEDDRKTYGIFANPDHTKHTIDSIWFEATEKDYKSGIADALKTFQGVKWKPEASARKK